MVVTFTTRYKGEPHTFQTTGDFSDGDPIVFRSKYDWHREISLINVGDAVRINETNYMVTALDIELTGDVTFTLEALTA